MYGMVIISKMGKKERRVFNKDEWVSVTVYSMPAVDCHQGSASFVIRRQAGNWNLWEEEKNLLCFPSILRKNSFPWKLNTFCCLQIRKWNNSVSRLPSNTQCQHCVKRKIFICKCSNKDIIKDLSIWISLQTTFNLSVKSADVYFGRESIRETYFKERKNPQKPK